MSEEVEANNSIRENQNSQTISTFKNFRIIINNKIINSEISSNIRTRYFLLCRTRRKFLHRHLSEGVSTKLAATVISGTTNIADAIRISEMFATRENIGYWNTALQSFVFLGMDVGFIRARLNRLLEIARNCSKGIKDWKNNRNIGESKVTLDIDEEVRQHEDKISELKILKRRIDMRGKEFTDEIVEKCKAMYNEGAKASW